MINKTIFSACILLVLSVGGCSDGSGGGISGSGIRDTDISIGRITGFGSVVINDQRFDTSESVIFSSGNRVTESDLSVGMIVSSAVDFEALTASRIEYLPQVIGPVSTSNGSSFTILGLNITPAENVNYEGISPADINAGIVLEVSGVVGRTGGILATFIRPATATDQYFVRGFANSLAFTFPDFPDFPDEFLNDFEIDIDQLFGIDQSVLLSVPFSNTNEPVVQYTMPEFEFTAGSNIDVTGYVENSDVSGQFSLGYIDVIISDQTSISGTGGDVVAAEDIPANALVRVQGSVFSTNSNVLASRIDILVP